MSSFWNLVSVNQKLSDELPAAENVMVVKVQPPWKVYLDGTVQLEGFGVGVVLWFHYFSRRIESLRNNH